MSTWITHLTAFYKEKKRTNPNYKYKDAMKDARSTYVSTTDHTPKSVCHRRKLTDCRKKSKCLVTKKGKRKSYCRIKTNPGPSKSSESLGSNSTSGIFSNIFGTNSKQESSPEPTTKSMARSTKSRSRRQKIKCQFKSRRACKRSKSCKTTVSGTVKSYCRKKTNSSHSRSKSRSRSA